MDFALILHAPGDKFQVILPVVQAALHEFGFRQPKVGQCQFLGLLHADVAAAPRQVLPLHLGHCAGAGIHLALVLHAAGDKLNVIFTVIQLALLVNELRFGEPEVGQGQFLGLLHADEAGIFLNLGLRLLHPSGVNVHLTLILHAAGNEFDVIFPIVQPALVFHELCLGDAKVGQGQFLGLLQGNRAGFVHIALGQGHRIGAQATGGNRFPGLFRYVFQKVIVRVSRAGLQGNHDVLGFPIFPGGKVAAFVDLHNHVPDHIFAFPAFVAAETVYHLLAVFIHAHQFQHPASAVIVHFNFRVYPDQQSARLFTECGAAGLVAGVAAQKAQAQGGGGSQNRGFLPKCGFHHSFSSSIFSGLVTFIGYVLCPEKPGLPGKFFLPAGYIGRLRGRMGKTGVAGKFFCCRPFRCLHR